MDYCVIIPARYQSTRLPRKPLINILGVPMIVRTYNQCIQACPREKVYVATDHEEIKKVCEERGIQVIMTSTDCLTGTDRVAECVPHIEADVYINVQGDEPVFNPEDLKRMISVITEYPGEILNGYCEIKDERMFRSPSVPKVVLRPDGRLLYMSRAAIPTNKELGFEKAWRQVCVYAFPKKALIDFSKHNNKTLLESMEDIEILRFLELGWDVRMIKLSSSSVPVDTHEDIKRAELAIKNNFKS